jgi:hypothetical protein
VHRRGEQHRAAGGQQGGGEQVVGAAGGGACEQVRGGGGDEDEVGFPAEPDVGDLVGVGPHVGGDRVAGQRRPGRLADETQGRGGGHHPHVVAAFGELAQYFDGFVGRDAPGDPEHDPWPPGCHRGGQDAGGVSGSLTVSWVSRPALISRSAIERGFSCALDVSTRGPTYSSSPSPSWE